MMRLGRRSTRVLVADDDIDVVKILRANLEPAGFEVHTASNGWEAQARALQVAPDVVVLDINMPGRNGLEVLGALRARQQTRNIPVVLLTARTADSDIWEGWKAGAAYYLTKPFDPDDLIRFINGVHEVGRGVRS
jgi:DNA-binding response OmpR family regulator